MTGNVAGSLNLCVQFKGNIQLCEGGMLLYEMAATRGLCINQLTLQLLRAYCGILGDVYTSQSQDILCASVVTFRRRGLDPRVRESVNLAVLPSPAQPVQSRNHHRALWAFALEFFRHIISYDPYHSRHPIGILRLCLLNLT